ncbi:hypothetical protein P280DRAFT_481998 [Massarina eburnea CBS 473.64]|uniref:Fucose-specific lectin n=1 Tax=Massarina eburnea CBS 473.64 TaxID=1395130 RepID=A0A6A6RST3_9PLEO|nr:hypothetical protein P280DRAFT_481998 [Massarina eburnea CBS 473.64]
MSPMSSPELTSTSPIQRYASPMSETSETMDNPPPMVTEATNEGFHPSQQKYNSQQYYSAPEVVGQAPPRYGSPPVGYPGDNFHSDGNPSAGYYDKGQPTQESTAVPTERPSEWRILGMKKRTFYIALFGIILLVLLIAGLAAGLAIGLKKKSSNNQVIQDPFCASQPEYCIGGSLNADYYSNKGAFNGTGIALAGESWNLGQRRIFTLYFQHHTGDIRSMQYGNDHLWVGGDKTNTIATDAKNATAISAVAYVLNNTGWFHLFYIGKDGNMKQVSQNNITNQWEAGELNAMNLKAYDSPMVGLQACWKGNYYGDPDFLNVPGASANSSRTSAVSAINLWYASSATTFEQYSWINGQDTWKKLDAWQGKNGHAGVGCYSWDDRSTSTYTMMVNSGNDTEIWWRDTNTNATSTDEHPINSWKNTASGAIPGVYPATSMGFTTYLYAQMADLTINGYNVMYQSENTYINSTGSFTITDPGGVVRGLAGTHLTCTSYTEFMDEARKIPAWDSLYVFFQTGGDDITAFTRPITGGQWTKAPLNITDA